MNKESKFISFALLEGRATVLPFRKWNFPRSIRSGKINNGHGMKYHCPLFHFSKYPFKPFVARLWHHHQHISFMLFTTNEFRARGHIQYYQPKIVQILRQSFCCFLSVWWVFNTSNHSSCLFSKRIYHNFGSKHWIISTLKLSNTAEVSIKSQIAFKTIVPGLLYILHFSGTNINGTLVFLAKRCSPASKYFF